MYFLKKAILKLASFFKRKHRIESEDALPNVYGSRGGTSYVKGLSNDEAQALFKAWNRKEKSEDRDGYRG